MHYGTAYYPDYFPEADWARDLDAMLRAGITRVRILEFGWCWYQPSPDVFRFEPLDRFLDLCLARGLRVCLSTPTATPPPWFFQKHPDCRLIDVSGQASYAHRHMVCWQHPGALAEALRTITALATRYARHPAVWGWQIDNEPNYAEKIDACYDFNPHALAAGQAWLRERHGSLAALNAAWFNAFWSQAYDDWSQVWVTHRPQTNPGSMLDFLRWREHALVVFVRAQRDLLRRLCPSHRIGVNIPEVGVHFSTTIGQDYWGQAAGLDWVGTDLYTGTPDRAADLRALRYSCDVMRSAVETASPAAEFILSETQGGPHLRTWEQGFAGFPWEADFLRDSVRVYAERGAKQVWYFLWRPVPGGQEIGMNATTDLDGGESDRTQEITRIAREDGPALASAEESYAGRPLALVHYSQDTHRFFYFFKQLDVLDRSHLGTHAWLDAQGYRIKYLNDADLEKPLPAAALLALPESHLLSDQAQRNVLAWAGDGAGPARQLHVGPHTALLDERGQLRGPARLHFWNSLGLRPGPWRDALTATTHDGHSVKACRAFTSLEGARVSLVATEQLTAADKRQTPACLLLRGNIHVHTHRWGEPFATGAGAQALPAPV